MALLDWAAAALKVRQALDEGGGSTAGPTGETRAPALYGFMASFGPLALIAVSLRFYARIRFVKLGWDDITIAIGMVLYTGLIIATVEAIKYGLGVHIWEVHRETEQQMQKCGFTSQVLYPASLGVIKLSIILFFIRILPPEHTWKKALYGLASWVVVSETAFTVALFLQCRPLNYYWDKTVEGTCFDQPKFYYVDAALNMATDLVILSVPWFVFRGLNLSRRKKYELLTICSVGVFTLISSIIRLPYLHGLNQSTDPTWDVVNIAQWSIAELGSAITLSSIPPIRPLFALYFPSLMGTLASQSGRGTDGGATGRMPTIGEISSRGKKTPTTITDFDLAAAETGIKSKQDWHHHHHQYIELDDQDDARTKRSDGTASEEHILPPNHKNTARVR